MLTFPLICFNFEHSVSMHLGTGRRMAIKRMTTPFDNTVYARRTLREIKVP